MEKLLEAENLKKHFTVRSQTGEKQTLKAVDGVSLDVRKGEVVGIVGESGCGKSTLGRTVLRLHEATEGTVNWKGQDLFSLHHKEMIALRKDMQMIFQDPFSSLNPRKRVARLVGQPLRIHKVGDAVEIRDRVSRLQEEVGINPKYARRYPHQFSGGQRQRIGIARALALDPELIVCDEAVSALDVSVQAQILNLLLDLREKHGFTYLFISHDLSVVEHISDRVEIMYLGRVVESAPTEALFEAPNHPYTQALLAEVPRIELRKRDYQPVKGEIPSPLDPPPGCHFHPRCPQATERCRRERPALKEISSGRWSACHLND